MMMIDDRTRSESGGLFTTGFGYSDVAKLFYITAITTRDLI